MSYVWLWKFSDAIGFTMPPCPAFPACCNACRRRRPSQPCPVALHTITAQLLARCSLFEVGSSRNSNLGVESDVAVLEALSVSA